MKYKPIIKKDKLKNRPCSHAEVVILEVTPLVILGCSCLIMHIIPEQPFDRHLRFCISMHLQSHSLISEMFPVSDSGCVLYQKIPYSS